MNTILQGQQKRKDCQTATPIDLCKLKIGVVQRVLTTKLGQSRDLATANYSRHIVLQVTYIHTACILATKPSMISITILFRVLEVKLVIFLLIDNIVTLNLFRLPINSTFFRSICNKCSWGRNSRCH